MHYNHHQIWENNRLPIENLKKKKMTIDFFPIIF